MEAFGGYLVDEKAVRVENAFLDFLKSFRSGQRNELYYEAEIEVMRANESNTMFIDFDHVIRFSDLLQKAISDEYLRFEPYLQNACKRFVMELKPTFISDDNPNKDINVAFYNIPIVKRLRELATSEIGRLVSVTGVVTRTSEVRPELLQGTFKCLECGGVIKNVEQQFKYTEPTICPNATCNNRAKWALLRQESKFTDWQRVRMQETSNEIPAGSLPRSLDVILRHEIVEHARAGDTVIFTGTVIVIPDILALASPGERSECRREASQRKGSSSGNEGVRGLRALGVRDLSYRLAFIANSVQICDGRREIDIRNRKKDSDEDDQQFTEQELDEVQRMRNTPDFFTKLVESVAPTIFGHQDIKRAILLMLMSGVHKSTHEGISLRGDINVCIVGDPSCAKSQFLKYTSSIVPRSVYTSGKSSSAAGLTATVAKEPETGEFCIEAGALMLADNGICCIDEFDKMDIRDQVAIHEAMEQQTISITKAGIQATLNARTSILAAANPAGGRYDRSKPLKYNVALPPAILSRFDLVYIMIDDPDDVTDYHIASHIVRVHQKREEALAPTFTTAELKRYIGYAKTLKPKLTSDARKLLVDSYVSLRRADTNPGSRVAYRMTVRQLEALIRLSEAIARCHLDNQVQPRHVRLAVKLLQTSIIRVESSEIDLSEFQDQDMDEEAGSGEGNDNNDADDGQVGSSTAQQAAGTNEKPADGSIPQRKKSTVTDEYFQRITKALVMRLRQHEETVMQKEREKTAKQKEDEETGDVLVKEYLDEVSTQLKMVCDSDSEELSLEEKHAFMHETRHAFGRTALLLSGGASLGAFHVGVVKTLVKHRLLPRIVAGSSVGSIMCAIVATRPWRELQSFFEDSLHSLQFFDQMGGIFAVVKRVAMRGAVHEIRQLQMLLRHLTNNLTFQEAYDMTGRVLGITVCSPRKHEPPRCLNYLTSPHVVIWSAVTASCAFPGLFEAQELMAKNRSGDIVPYHPPFNLGPEEGSTPSRRWRDGSLEIDLPMMQLKELFNVNHFIVSQANPHIAPLLRLKEFVRTYGGNFAAKLAHLVVLEVKHRCNQVLELGFPLGGLAKLFAQEWEGDVTIVMPATVAQYLKIIQNPSLGELQKAANQGRRCSWEKLSAIKANCEIELALDESVAHVNNMRRLKRISERTASASHGLSSTVRFSASRRIPSWNCMARENSASSLEDLTDAASSLHQAIGSDSENVESISWTRSGGPLMRTASANMFVDFLQNLEVVDTEINRGVVAHASPRDFQYHSFRHTGPNRNSESEQKEIDNRVASGSSIVINEGDLLQTEKIHNGIVFNVVKKEALTPSDRCHDFGNYNNEVVECDQIDSPGKEMDTASSDSDNENAESTPSLSLDQNTVDSS